MNETHERGCPRHELQQAAWGEASPEMCVCKQLPVSSWELTARNSMTRDEARQAHADGLALGGGLNEYFDQEQRAAEPVANDAALYLAVGERHGELITRHGRPLFATRDEWSKLPRVKVTMLIATAEYGMPFGCLPLMDRGDQPDIVGDLMASLAMVTKLTDMVAQRLALLDRLIEKVGGK